MEIRAEQDELGTIYIILNDHNGDQQLTTVNNMSSAMGYIEEYVKTQRRTTLLRYTSATNQIETLAQPK